MCCWLLCEKLFFYLSSLSPLTPFADQIKGQDDVDTIGEREKVRDRQQSKILISTIFENTQEYLNKMIKKF